MYCASFIILSYDQQMRNYFTNYPTPTCFDTIGHSYYYYYYYRYSALGPVRAETRAQSGDWYCSGTLHPRQILRGSLPLLSPIGHSIKKNIYIYIYIKKFSVSTALKS
jgi:hypothetical protein